MPSPEYFINVEILQTVISLIVLIVILAGFFMKISKMIDEKMSAATLTVTEALKGMSRRQDRLDLAQRRTENRFAGLRAEHNLMTGMGVHCPKCTRGLRNTGEENNDSGGD